MKDNKATRNDSEPGNELRLLKEDGHKLMTQLIHNDPHMKLQSGPRISLELQ